MIILECDRCGKTERCDDFRPCKDIKPAALIVGGGVAPQVPYGAGTDLCQQCVQDIRQLMITRIPRQA